MTNKFSTNSLKPSTKPNVMDLVQQVGIDTASWHFRKDGTKVTNPAANPAYCYQWAYGGGKEPIIFCLWFDSLTANHGLIECIGNLRKFKSSRQPSQEQRAKFFEHLLEESFANNTQVRAFIQVGKNQSKRTTSKTKASVKYRALDDHYWTVKSFSKKTGEFHLVRGNLFISDRVEEVSDRYLDQYSLPIPPERIVGTNSSFFRSPAIRAAVLLRAKGICEHCGQKGFKMDNGSVYLETHHVFPLAQGGP
jgi:5-methylcytosine-specific restriction protein A